MRNITGDFHRDCFDLASLSSIGDVLNYFHVVIKYLGSDLKVKGFPLCPCWGEHGSRAGAATAVAAAVCAACSQFEEPGTGEFPHSRGFFFTPFV